MSWNAISGIVPQFTESGNQANGYVIKFYDVGTLTPQAVATDSTGGTTATNFLLNTEGYATSSGNIIIPHVQSNYKLVLYLNQADADANNTGSAVYVVDNIQGATVSAGSIGLTQLYDIPDANIIIGGTAANGNYPITGDATVSNTGVLTLGTGVVDATNLASGLGAVIPDQKGGLGLSNGTDTQHDIDIASGVCADSTSDSYITYAGGTIQIDANIGAGNGGLPVGLSLTADTWYRVFICAEAAGANPQAVFDISPTASNARNASNLGATYTLYRRIGWVRTNASSDITQFVQRGNLFSWDAPANDMDEVSAATSRTAQELTVPPTSTALFNVYFERSGAGLGDRFLLLTEEGQDDVAPSINAFSAYCNLSTWEERTIARQEMFVNSNSEIYYRSEGSSTIISIYTLGWNDRFID